MYCTGDFRFFEMLFVNIQEEDGGGSQGEEEGSQGEESQGEGEGSQAEGEGEGSQAEVSQGEEEVAAEPKVMRLAVFP